MMDTEIKRMVLKELMDKLDGMDRNSMRPDLMADQQPHDEMDQMNPDADKEVMIDAKMHKEPDEDDMPSIDPVVMLAKKFHR